MGKMHKLVGETILKKGKVPVNFTSESGGRKTSAVLSDSESEDDDLLDSDLEEIDESSSTSKKGTKSKSNSKKKSSSSISKSKRKDEEKIGKTKALLATATKYLEQGQAEDAVQIFTYALNDKAAKFESPVDKCRGRLNLCLSLQRCRRTKDLLYACNDALKEIKSAKEVLLNAEVSTTSTANSTAKQQLTRLEAACYTRRGWAYNELGNEASAGGDAAEAKRLLSSLSK